MPAVAAALLGVAAAAEAFWRAVSTHASAASSAIASGDWQLAVVVLVLLSLATTLPLGFLWAQPAAAAVAISAACLLSLGLFQMLTVAGLVAQLTVLYRLGRCGSQLLAAAEALWRALSTHASAPSSGISSGDWQFAAVVLVLLSLAVSACTAIMEMWWATTSCSSRDIRARSPRAVFWSRVSVMTCWAARCAWASACARLALPAQAAAGASEASSTARIWVSPPAEPTRARTRNGAARPAARS